MTQPTTRQVRPADDAAAPSAMPKLSFSVPRRGKPPQHLADLTAPDRAAALIELGHPGYRAKQISTHYFSHLTRDPYEMSDIPATLPMP